MQSRIGEHGIELLVEVHGGGVPEDKFQVWVVLAGLADHLRRGIQAKNVRAAFGDLLRQASRTAAEIENSLPRFGLQQFDYIRSELPDERMPGFVKFRIPSRFQDV
jgi:hypothetical protein